MEEIKKLNEAVMGKDIQNQKLQREILMIKEVSSEKEKEAKEMLEQIKKNNLQAQGKLLKWQYLI